MKWRCTDCGKPHDENAPPCDNCGCWQFEKGVVRQVAADATQSGSGDTGASTTEWRCPECGRRHTKNAPPCNRCGHMRLEPTALTADEIAMPRTGLRGWVDSGGKYLAGIVVVFALLAMAFAGVVDVPGIGPEPTVSDVPGHADRASGLNLSAVEREVHERTNRERRQEGLDPISYDAELAEIARYHNRGLVKWGYSSPRTNERSIGGLYDQFGYSCASPAGNANRIAKYGGVTERPVDEFANETELARVIVSEWLESEDIRGNLLGERDADGVDVHVDPDGNVFVTQTFC